MKPHKPNPFKLIGMCFVFVYGISYTLSAQQKFMVQLKDGTYKQYSINGLKLTFDNNGSFSIWQNYTKQEMSFAAVDKVTFTEQAVNILKNNFSPSISSYVDPSGMLHIKGESVRKTEVCIFSLQGVVLFKKEQLISDAIDIRSLKPGVYVLKAGNQYIKFLKP
jgi:hypothetical protein